MGMVNNVLILDIPQPQGVCISGSECNARGGLILGSCAQGFGSCCAIYVSTCGSSNFQFNLTYIVNTGTWSSLRFVTYCIIGKISQKMYKAIKLGGPV